MAENTCTLESEKYDVSVIIPVYNGEKWIDKCIYSIQMQNAMENGLKIEICVCNDGSVDNTKSILEYWKQYFEDFKCKNHGQIRMKIYDNTGPPKGVGYAKNRAVEISTGTYLCFQDADDFMMPNRILKQYETAKALPDNVNALIGCKFSRDPPDSTLRYTKWANYTITPEKLNLQIYTSNGPTIIMPTWFCHRNVYNRVRGFSEEGRGTPEDLIFFYQHLDYGGIIARTDHILLVYCYHPEATTFSIDEKTIWDIRLERLQKKVLPKWKQFTIWNAGKQGRKFYKSLSKENQEKVTAFCDVDEKKIGKLYEPYDEITRTVDRKINIVHFSKAQPPFVICVKLDLTDGDFEKNLNSLKLEEGVDYVLFS